MKTCKEEAVQLLKRLQELGFEISGCGCCGSPIVGLNGKELNEHCFDAGTDVEKYVSDILGE